MKKIIFKTFTLLSVLILMACSSDDNNNSNEVSILGEWTHSSTTDSKGDTTFYYDKCPNTINILTNTIRIIDYIDVKEPCINFDTIILSYTISNNFITTTNSNGGNETLEILTLNSDTLKLKLNNNHVIEYKRTL